MWFFKEKKKKKQKDKNRLTIHFTDGSCQYWEHEVYTKGKITPWIDFYKWFHGRKQSKSFAMKARDNETTIIRENIYTFSVDIIKGE